MTNPTLGFCNVAEGDYHRGPGIGHSGLVTLADRSPAHYMWDYQHPRESTEQMDVGSAFHCALLRPNDFDGEFVKCTGENRNSKAWKDWAADQRKAGKTIIREKDFYNVFRMVTAVREHSRASILCNPDDVTAEVTGYWQDPQTNVLCKLRADAINETHDVLVDVKKARDASYSAFIRAVADYGYHIQRVHYVEGMFRLSRPMQEFIFVVVEDTPPWGVACYYLDAETIRFATTRWRRSLDVYAHCLQNNTWPNYPEEIRELNMPPWALRGKVG